MAVMVMVTAAAAAAAHQALGTVWVLLLSFRVHHPTPSPDSPVRWLLLLFRLHPWGNGGTGRSPALLPWLDLS